MITLCNLTEFGPSCLRCDPEATRALGVYNLIFCHSELSKRPEELVKPKKKKGKKERGQLNENMKLIDCVEETQQE